MAASNVLTSNVPGTPLAVVPRIPTARELVFTYGKYVWRLLRYLGVADRDLDDVCQEVFTTALRRIDSLTDDGIRPWLHAICINHAKNYRRRASRRRELLVETLPEPTVSGQQEENLDRSRARELLPTLLDRLDDDHRAAFVLFSIEGVPMEQVAKTLGCPLSTAYVRVQRARKQLEKFLVNK